MYESGDIKWDAAISDPRRKIYFKDEEKAV